MIMIKTILLYIICFTVLSIYCDLSVYVANNDNAIISKLIFVIISIIAPLIFVLKYLV